MIYGNSSRRRNLGSKARIPPTGFNSSFVGVTIVPGSETIVRTSVIKERPNKRPNEECV